MGRPRRSRSRRPSPRRSRIPDSCSHWTVHGSRCPAKSQAGRLFLFRTRPVTRPSPILFLSRTWPVTRPSPPLFLSRTRARPLFHSIRPERTFKILDRINPLPRLTTSPCNLPRNQNTPPCGTDLASSTVRSWRSPFGCGLSDSAKITLWEDSCSSTEATQ